MRHVRVNRSEERKRRDEENQCAQQPHGDDPHCPLQQLHPLRFCHKPPFLSLTTSLPRGAAIMSRRTKIVATLGPATDTPEMLDAILRAGVDVARVNFSHGVAD